MSDEQDDVIAWVDPVASRQENRPMSEHDGEICERCEQEYILRPDCEPTRYCDKCAQEVVIERDSDLTALRARLAEVEGLLDCRAGSLLRKGKTFVVVAVDEPYFSHVYDLIRKHENRGRWDATDEAFYKSAMDEFNFILEQKAGEAARAAGEEA